MTRRVLLTGATGFVGRHAVQPLLDRGYEVHAAARTPPAMSGVVPHVIDLMDAHATAALVRSVRPSHLLHLAWDVTPGRFWTTTANLDWVAASLRLYRAFADAGGQRATVAGTCAEYDWTAGTLEEDAAPRPATLYGTSKHALHQVLAAVEGVSLGWGRVFFLYGPHEAPSRLVPSVVTPLLRGEPALLGDGRAQRDFMHVQDVASALVAVLDSGHVGAVNIATGECHAIRDVAMALARQIGRPDLVRLGARQTPANEPQVLFTAAGVLRSIGFSPRFTLPAGLADTVAWWRSVDDSID